MNIFSTNSLARKLIFVLLLGIIILLVTFLLLIMPMSTKAENVLHDEKYFIAHAGGTINGYTYLNCKEGFVSALNSGFRYIELDLCMTTDSILVCAHDWKSFHNLSSAGDSSSNNSLSEKDFLQRKILNKFTPMTLREAANLMNTYSFVLVTDKISDVKILNRFLYEKRSRVMVEAFSVQDYVDLKRSGYTPMLSVYDFDFSQFFWMFVNLPLRKHVKIEWICVHSSSNLASLRLLKRLFDCKVAMYGSNDTCFYKQHLNREVDLVYTNMQLPINHN